MKSQKGPLHSQRHSGEALTVVELLLVISIIIVLATFSAVGYQRFLSKTKRLINMKERKTTEILKLDPDSLNSAP